MNEKKQEHDGLLKRHEHDLWREDLDAFAEALEIEWAREERDRLAQGAKKGEVAKGKGRRRAPAKKAKAAIQDRPGQEPENEPMSANKVKKPRKPRQMGAAEATMKQKEPEEMSLRERMAAKFGKDMPMQSSLLSGKQGLTAAQQASK